MTIFLPPLLQAYKVGLQRFQEAYKRAIELNGGTEVCPSLATCCSIMQIAPKVSPTLDCGCLQGLRLNAYMDLDMRDCMGADMDNEGRREEDEIRVDLASFDLIKPGGTWIWPSHDCHFELVQQDIIAFPRADMSEGAFFGVAFLLKCTVQSKSGKLRGAEVHLSINEREDFVFLDIAMPPKGVDFVAPHEVGGVIEFKEGKPWNRLFVDHQTFGAMSCGMLGSKEAFVRLCPDQGTQEVSCLSAVVLVCLTDSEGTSFDMFASVGASLSHTGVLRKLRKSNHTYRIGGKKVQLSTDPRKISRD